MIYNLGEAEQGRESERKKYNLEEISCREKKKEKNVLHRVDAFFRKTNYTPVYTRYISRLSFLEI